MQSHESLDWSQIEGPRGPATDVPRLLEELHAKDAKVRERALSGLTDIFNHQNSISPAAVPGARALVDVLTADCPPSVAASLFALLADLVCGGTHITPLSRGRNTIDGIKHPEFVRATEEIKAYLEPNISQLLAGLEGAQDDVRAAAYLLLAFVATRDQTIDALLQKRVAAEKSPQPAASALLALALRAANNPAADPCLPELAAEGLPRLAGQVGRCFLAPEEVDEDTGLELLDAVSEYARPVPHFYWCEGEVDNLLILALSLMSARTGNQEILELTLDAAAGKPTAPIVAGRLIMTLFDSAGPAERLRAPHELSDIQIGTLELVASKKLGFKVQASLASCGLPSSDQGLVRFCAQARAPQGEALLPFDRQVDGEPLWRILNDVVSGRANAEAWFSALGQLSEDALVSLLRDVQPFPYAAHRPFPPRRAAEQDTVDWLDLVAEGIARGASLDRIEEAVAELASDHPQRHITNCALIVTADRAYRRRDQSLPAKHDALLGRVLASLREHIDLLRQVLERLPLERRAALVEPLELGYGTADGQLWVRGAWHYADLCPTRTMIARIVEALVKNTKTVIPEDLARAAFEANPTDAAELAAAALADAKPPARQLLEEFSGQQSN